jgi:hypothetical protein
LLIGLCLAAAACGSESAVARSNTPMHVDSSISPAVELARFREGLTQPRELASGANSRDGLVGAFVRALAKRDTGALADLLLTRAEFAYLYYPTNPQAQPPYNLSPGLMWFMLEGHSRRGVTQLLAQRAGQELHFAGYTCQRSLRQGENTVWTGCTVRRRASDGQTMIETLFGPIVERDGRFKFASYANKL